MEQLEIAVGKQAVYASPDGERFLCEVMAIVDVREGLETYKVCTLRPIKWINGNGHEWPGLLTPRLDEVQRQNVLR